MSHSSGIFLTIEGIEGTGKSTQSALLAEAIARSGREVLATREPGGGGGRLGDTLRALLKDPEVFRPLALAEIHLYAADRAWHVESRISPALERGAVVVCDRYLDSTRCYQGHGRGRPLPLIDALHAHPPLDLRPARTLLFDLPVDEALSRARARRGADAPGYDGEAAAFFERVREGFLATARAEPRRVRVIDAAGAPGAVHRRALSALEDLLPGLVASAGAKEGA